VFWESHDLGKGNCSLFPNPTSDVIGYQHSSGVTSSCFVPNAPEHHFVRREEKFGISIFKNSGVHLSIDICKMSSVSCVEENHSRSCQSCRFGLICCSEVMSCVFGWRRKSDSAMFMKFKIVRICTGLVLFAEIVVPRPNRHACVQVELRSLKNDVSSRVSIHWGCVERRIVNNEVVKSIADCCIHV